MSILRNHKVLWSWCLGCICHHLSHWRWTMISARCRTTLNQFYMIYIIQMKYWWSMENVREVRLLCKEHWPPWTLTRIAEHGTSLIEGFHVLTKDVSSCLSRFGSSWHQVFSQIPCGTEYWKWNQKKVLGIPEQGAGWKKLCRALYFSSEDVQVPLISRNPIDNFAVQESVVLETDSGNVWSSNSNPGSTGTQQYYRDIYGPHKVITIHKAETSFFGLSCVYSTALVILVDKQHDFRLQRQRFNFRSVWWNWRAPHLWIHHRN